MKRSDLFRIFLLACGIIGISLLHYLTPLHLPMLHDIFQRLYYIPIILAAYWFGVRGGLGASITTSMAYAPHILFQWGIHPSLELEKFLEIVLYNVVGGITGFLSQSEAMRREELQKTADGLEDSYRKLQRQADLIIQIQEQLRRAERFSVMGELSAVLAHEIRNPLGSIKGTAEILRDDFSPGDSKFEFLEILIKETERLNRVVEEFLTLAKTEHVATEAFDLNTELDEVLSIVAGEAQGRGVALKLEKGSLPLVHGDRDKLRQVFLNIILNGIQATGRGGNLTVSTSPVPSGDDEKSRVRVLFADTGEGIEPGYLERIFEPFFTTKSGGTGLGLAITQRIVESHNGNLAVASAPGKGSTFTLELPS